MSAKLKVKQTMSARNRFGARKYALIPSETKEDTEYMVAKIRKRDKKHYRYVCSCPIFVATQRKCKHIKRFIEAEKHNKIQAVV
jgi:hypothetical protein